MRKYIKEQLTGLLSTIGEAHRELGICIDSGDRNSCIELLEACQTAAISVGTQIEESEGEGTTTVGRLEEYCEHLYNISLGINADNNTASEAVTGLLNDSLAAISESLRNDIRIRKEVIFLPYKASMWDSLESVWKKADADPDVDAYVIPIPYYDKNPDGTPKEIYYEGDEYPDYVPVTSYKEYNIPARRPDEIYIHNPYDSFNRVTSVFPEYYSSELKKYTDRLVYIPYFVVLGDEVPKHFIVLPGTIHAHNVIVQSEEIKQSYIRGFMEYAEEQHIDPKVFGNLDEKFLPLGSPKIEKVMNTTIDDITIPDEWKRFTDSGRKIILYNTTLQTFMDNKDMYLDKVARVFDIFRDNKEVVLLWRPHPLMRDTLQAMYPEKYEAYMSIVEEYKREGFGIYDDTADINRAIVLSDAYYGDMSSVVEMYRATKKPIMIQSVYV